jgi:glycine cleavage system H protein
LSVFISKKRFTFDQTLCSQEKETGTNLKLKNMNIPGNLLYTKDHEWIRVEGDSGFVGVTDFAQGELGDVVFVEIETLGETLAKEEPFGTIEAVKTVSDMFMPVSGEILEVNPLLEESPDVVNKDPYGKGWMVKIKISKPSELEELLTPDAYSSLAGA